MPRTGTPGAPCHHQTQEEGGGRGSADTMTLDFQPRGPHENTVWLAGSPGKEGPSQQLGRAGRHGEEFEFHSTRRGEQVGSASSAVL